MLKKSNISFYIKSNVFLNNNILKDIKKIISLEKKKLGDIVFYFFSDAKIKQINAKHLKHFYYTDVITFNYNFGNFISGEIFISNERIIKNSKKLKENYNVELHRVIYHAVLHLCGHDDKTKKQKAKIRKKEDKYLKMFHVKPNQ